MKLYLLFAVFLTLAFLQTVAFAAEDEGADANQQQQPDDGGGEQPQDGAEAIDEARSRVWKWVWRLGRLVLVAG